MSANHLTVSYRKQVDYEIYVRGFDNQPIAYQQGENYFVSDDTKQVVETIKAMIGQYQHEMFATLQLFADFVACGNKEMAKELIQSFLSCEAKS